MKYYLIFFLFLVFVGRCQAQHLKLSLNLTKGNTYYLSGSSNTDVLQTVNEKQNKINLWLNYRMAFKVISIADSIYNMEVTYKTLKLTIVTANSTVEMDSRKNDQEDAPSMIIAAMMNRPFTVTMNRQGKIRSVKNIEKIITGIFDQFPQVGTAQKEQIKKELLQNFSGDTFKGNVELQTAIFPESKVINDRWVVNTKMQGVVKISIHTNYQLKGKDNSSYLIHGEGVTVTDKNMQTGTINGMPVKYNITGTSKADIKVDKVSGWISEVKLKQVMKGDVEILDNPKVPGGLKIPMTYDTEINTIGK